MPPRSSPHPTEAELEILNVLWQKGPSTVRAVHQTLQADRSTGLTTTLKMLQVMTEKKLVVRDEEARPHRYSPARPKEKTQAGLLDELARRAFNGSVRKLLVRAVEDGRLSDEELKAVGEAIRQIRRGSTARSPRSGRRGE